MLLGIPFHAASLYARGGEIFGTNSVSETANVISDSIHSFRMQAFFIIAGYFAMKTITRTTPRLWMQKRLVRLGLPLVSSLTVIGPVLLILNSINVLSSMRDTWSVYILNASSHFSLAVLFGHLWFLRDLLLVSFAFCCSYGLFAAYPRAVALIDRGIGIRTKTPVDFAWINVLLVAYECGLTLANHHHPFGTWLFGAIEVRDLFRLVGFFVYGTILERRLDGFSWFCRFRWQSVLISALAIVVYNLCCDLDTTVAKTLTTVAWCISGIWTSQTVISICCSRFSVDSQIIRKLTDASLTMYIVHYPIVSILGSMLFFTDAAVGLKIAFIIVCTTAISYMLHQLVKKSPLALLMFNGVRPRPTTGLRAIRA